MPKWNFDDEPEVVVLFVVQFSQAFEVRGSQTLQLFALDRKVWHFKMSAW